jgi:2-oxoglutarate-dependent dioxygenase
VRALFDLPDDAKRRNADVITGSGYVAPSPTNPLYEAFGLLDAAVPTDVDAFCALLDAPPNIRLAAPHSHAPHKIKSHLFPFHGWRVIA